MTTRRRKGADKPDALRQCIVRAAGYPGYGAPSADLGGEGFRRWLGDNALRHMLGFFAQALDTLGGPGTAGQPVETTLRALRAKGIVCSFHDEILSLIAARHRARQARPARFIFRWVRPAFFSRANAGWIPVDPARLRERSSRGALFVEWRRMARPVAAGQALIIPGADLRAIGLMLCTALDELRSGTPAPVVLAEMRRAPRQRAGARVEIRAQTAL
jgi:hypothetical protein